MTRTLKCPRCGHGFEVTEGEAGEVCDVCGQMIVFAGEPRRFAAAGQHDLPPVRSVTLMTVLGWLAAASVLLCCCGGLGSVYIYHAVQSARLNSCIGNCKNIGLAFHNHYDVHQRLPLASSEPVTGIPASTDLPHPAGYSWVVALLPFLEEQYLSDKLDSDSLNLNVHPFDSAVTLPVNGEYVGCEDVRVLHCYSARALRVNVDQSDYWRYSAHDGKKAPAASSYAALSASHRLNFHGLAELADSDPNDDTEGNGALVFPNKHGQNLHHGLPFKKVTDGTSKTMILCETREVGYAAWIDGQVTWRVGAWPQNISVPNTKHTRDGYLGWPDSDESSITSMNAAIDETNVYLQAAQFGGKHVWKAGPSSDHPQGVVVHAFVDGHVLPISPTIDRNLYLRLITRNGGEAIEFD